MLQHGLHPVPGPGELLLAPAGQGLPAFPEGERLVEAQAADLQDADDLGELVAGLLVAQRRHVRAGRLVGSGSGGHGAPVSTTAATAPSATRTRSRVPGPASSTDRRTGRGAPAAWSAGTRCTTD